MWSIQLLGGLAAHRAQGQVIRFRTQKAAALLAYLALHPAPQSREMLTDLLWPDAEPEVGRHNLSNALSFLRHHLEPRGVPPGTVLLADRASVRLNPAAVMVDVVEFESELNQAAGLSDDQRLSLLLQAVERYAGALLPGYDEEWIAPEALRLESRFVQAVVQLVPLLLHVGRLEQALMYAQRAVSADPLSEEATHCLMQTLSACGQSGQALRAYRQLERRLAEELDTRPSPELQRLAEQLGSSGIGRKIDLEVGGLPADEAVVLSRSSPSRAEHPTVTTASAAAGVMSRGRLVGGEFLLRTTTRFFGREEEIARLGRMLSTPRTRLVTLTGSGGTGKTRLALEVAAHLVERTTETVNGDAPTRAVFVGLASVTDPGRLFDVTLRSLGIVPASNQDPFDQLANVLEAHPNTLLVLDNFEQLVEKGALRVQDLLGKSASVKLLLTSRQRLQIEGEREFHLAPLPTTSGTHSLDALLQVPSIALFVDRAQTALPNFQLTERNAAAVSQLCDYLEGLPLAIELAAARVALLTPARILEQVQADRLDFLATHRRDAASRQQTLRATLDWSYQLLPETGQRFLAHVSVFRGGWMLEAAQAICALSEGETLELLTQLRDSSLLQVTDTDEGMRFTLLETICEYGQEKVKALGEDFAVCGRHRDYFAALLEQAEPELTGPDQARWLDRLETEHDNLQAALAWSLEEGRGGEGEKGRSRAGRSIQNPKSKIETSLWLVGALSRFWEVRGYLSLGRGYLARALCRAEAAASTAERAKALQGAGALAFRQGDYASARTLDEQSLVISRELGDKHGIAYALINLGSVATQLGDYDTARTLHEKVLAIRRELGDKGGIAFALFNLGTVASRQDDYGAAKSLFEQSLAIRRELGEKGGMAHSLLFLGTVARDQGDYEAARTLLQKSLALYRETGNSWIIHALGHLGRVEREVGDYARAATLYQESLWLRREQGNGLGIAESLEDFAGLAGRQGQWERAVRLLGAAEALCQTLDRTPPAGDAPVYERTVANAHAALSEERFAATWEAGRAMTLEQAVAYALAREGEDPPDDVPEG